MTGLMSRVWDLRRTEHGRRVVAFGLIGLFNLVLDVALFNLLLHVLDKPLTSKFFASTVALIASYYMNRHWTWRDRKTPKAVVQKSSVHAVGRSRRWRLRKEPILFFGLSMVGVGIAEVCLLISHYGLNLTSTLADNVSANLVGLGLGMIWRYWSYNKWVFTVPAIDAPGMVVDLTTRDVRLPDDEQLDVGMLDYVDAEKAS